MPSLHPQYIVVYKHLAKIEPQGRSARFKAATTVVSSTGRSGRPNPLVFSEWGCGCKEMAWCKLRRSWPSQMRSEVDQSFPGEALIEVKWRLWALFRGRLLQGLFFGKLAIHVGNVPGAIDLLVQGGLFEITGSQATNIFKRGWAQCTLNIGFVGGIFYSWLKLLMSIAPHPNVHGKCWTSWA